MGAPAVCTFVLVGERLRGLTVDRAREPQFLREVPGAGADLDDVQIDDRRIEKRGHGVVGLLHPIASAAELQAHPDGVREVRRRPVVPRVGVELGRREHVERDSEVFIRRGFRSADGHRDHVRILGRRDERDLVEAHRGLVRLEGKRGMRAAGSPAVLVVADVRGRDLVVGRAEDFGDFFDQFHGQGSSSTGTVPVHIRYHIMCNMSIALPRYFDKPSYVNPILLLIFF